MILANNINILKRDFPGINWDEIINICESKLGGNISLTDTPKGLPALEVKTDTGSMYLHSKYDPINEAERIVSQYQNVEKGKHILFYGLGMGYLIKAFVKKYPYITYSVYEPDPAVFYHFLSNIPLEDFPVHLMNNLFVEDVFQNEEFVKYGFFRNLGLNVELVALPSYTRAFPQKHKKFSEDFLKSIADAGINIRTLYFFEKQWMVNFIRSFKETITTPNILELDKKFFAGKPAILAAAGPSLEEEMDRLRDIKQNGLAYIFSVGSAIKSLMAHGIKPDAICAVDGLPNNCDLFERFIEGEEKEKEIPLIFGTALFSDVVLKFEGKKFHMIINNDPLAEDYLRFEDNKITKIERAPTVAITTLQLLHKLGCDPIILAGQNYAFRNNRYYSAGIDDYEGRSVTMTEKDKNEVFTVEDVHGGTAETKNDLDTMRRQMEFIIDVLDIDNVINTTKGGAKIKGTSFETLEEVMKSRLSAREVVDEWSSERTKEYDMEHLLKKRSEMMKEREKMLEVIGELSDVIERIKRLNSYKSERDINNHITKFSGIFSKLMRNEFYKVFIYNMNTVQHDILLNDVEVIALEKDLFKKAQAIGEKFEVFIRNCKEDEKLIGQLFDEMNGAILQVARSKGIQQT